MPFCPSCGSRYDGTLRFCGSCGQQLPTVPLTQSIPTPATPLTDLVSTIIPYRNVPALIAYYCGVFALLGFPAPVAVILGILGLKKAAVNPQAKGKTHAWIGIILGGLFCVIYGIVLLSVLALKGS